MKLLGLYVKIVDYFLFMKALNITFT